MSPLIQSIRRIQARGIFPWAGMIVGFDNDDYQIFAEQLKFVRSQPHFFGNLQDGLEFGCLSNGDVARHRIKQFEPDRRERGNFLWPALAVRRLWLGFGFDPFGFGNRFGHWCASSCILG
jgi:hypothetical protein